MSHTRPTNTSPSRFQQSFDGALKEFAKHTKKGLLAHPVAAQLQACQSTSAVLTVLQEHVQGLDSSGSGDDKLARSLLPIVNILCEISTTLEEGTDLAFSPSKVLLTGVGVLLSAARDIPASQDTLTPVFERIRNHFQRLEIYTGMSPTLEMTDIILRVMAEILFILAIATKEIKQSRPRKYMKKWMGVTEMEDALKRLDNLTREEAQMATAQVLKATHVAGGGPEFIHMADVVDTRVQEIMERVHGVDYRVRELMDNVLSADDKVAEVDNRINDRMTSIEDRVPVVNDKMVSVGDGAKETKRKQLLQSLGRWLLPLDSDPLQNHNVACQTRYKGTAAWFLQSGKYKEWKSTAVDPQQGSGGSLLWIHGKPGAGKSIFCSAIIDDIEAKCTARVALMGFFYFDVRHSLKRNRLNMVSSLLIQLSTRSTLCCDILARFHSAHERGADIPSIAVLTECLKEMLSHPSQPPIYLILDALDECPNTSGVPSPREDVLALVKELANLPLPKLHLCITSRLELDIQAVLEPLITPRVSLDNEVGHKRDIITYISSAVHSDRRIQGWKTEGKQMVIDKLSETADGTFRFASCQLEAIRASPQQDICRILDESPQSLDETYERILREISNINRDYVHRLLQCLTVSVRPLRVEELASVVAVDFDAIGVPNDRRPGNQEHAILSPCPSLISVVDVDGSRVVQFSHPSIKAFLLSGRLADSNGRVSRYHVDLVLAHTHLAQACLSVLLRLDDDHLDRDNIKKIPFAVYAARHWVDHAQFENVASNIRDRIELLFDQEKPYFAKWIWIYDMDQSRGLATTHATRPNATPLYYATLCGLADVARHLIVTHPEDVDGRGGRYTTAIHAASYKGDLSIARLLIQYGADVNSRDDEGRTPLHIAAQSRDPKLAKLLLSFGALADVTNNSYTTPLLIASKSGNFEVTQLLIDAGADVNMQDDRYSTPLHIASGNGDLDVVRALLEYGGANVHARDDHDSTPLHLASAKGNPAVVELLTQHGANMNALDDTNSTPLHLALINENLKVIDHLLLIRHDADVNISNNKRRTPLHLAAASANLDVVESLLRRGANANVNVNARDNTGSSPLHLLLASGSASASVQPVVELLIRHGADVNARDNEDSTPSQVAARRGRHDIVEFLLAHGATAEPSARDNNNDNDNRQPRRRNQQKQMSLQLLPATSSSAVPGTSTSTSTSTSQSRQVQVRWGRRAPLRGDSSASAQHDFQSGSARS